MSGFFYSAKNVCYICGHVALKSLCRCLTHVAKQADCLYSYFGCHVADAGNIWVRQLRWITCYVILIKCMKGKTNSMPPAVPMIWRVPVSHLEDCCFCLKKSSGIRRKANLKYRTTASQMQ